MDDPLDDEEECTWNDLGGGFKYLFCDTPVPAEMIQFDKYFSKWIETANYVVIIVGRLSGTVLFYTNPKKMRYYPYRIGGAFHNDYPPWN